MPSRPACESRRYGYHSTPHIAAPARSAHVGAEETGFKVPSKKMGSCTVLHITSLLGGGVDRHVRDIARSAPGRHVVWHASEAADVIEVPGTDELLPLDAAAIHRDPPRLGEWLRAHEVGVVHV